ncbi:MAG: lamin tail domain-containing protein [Candidatus Nanoarchaeia archaeon]|nr:lamin tail domain-containing protein [Candidatus Nanoarchaeia archaeon]
MNKRKAWLLILAACLLAASCRLAAAGLLVTEVMYNPNQCDDTDGEWVEIYNNGETSVDLSRWLLNNKPLEGTLSAKQYLVIAKELVDGTDADTDSFEKYWGNNDGVWDEADGFRAMQLSVSLANSAGIVNLTNGNETDILQYTSAMGANGNGKSLQRTLELGWEEAEATPGAGAFQAALENDELEYELEIENVAPRIIYINITPDEMDADGIQIIAGNKTVKIEVSVADDNGIEDIANVTAFLDGREIAVIKVSASNETAFFEASLNFQPSDDKKQYNLSITAFDYETNATETRTIEYVSRIATVLETRSVNFGKLKPGESKEATVAVRNTGIDAVKVSFSADTNLVIEAFNGNWVALKDANVLINAGEREEIKIRAFAPKKKAGFFKGKLKIIAKAA